MDLIQGDCLNILPLLKAESVDLILTDPPYGTIKGMKLGTWDTSTTEWDETICHESYFKECNRILRANGTLILFSQEPYTSRLITEAHRNVPFSYRKIWKKNNFANSFIVNKAPVSYFEDICIFFKKHPKHDFKGFHPLRPYAKKILDFIGVDTELIVRQIGQKVDHFFRVNSPQFTLCTEDTYLQLIEIYGIDKVEGFETFAGLKFIDTLYRKKIIEEMTLLYPKVFNLHEGKKYKSNILEFKKDCTRYHPTQKPVALMEDLIKTYTNARMTVLDFAFGSCTTGVAAKKLNRRFIGIEKNLKYFKIAKRRLKNETQ